MEQQPAPEQVEAPEQLEAPPPRGCPLCQRVSFRNTAARHLHNTKKHRNKLEFECGHCLAVFKNGPEKAGHDCRDFAL